MAKRSYRKKSSRKGSKKGSRRTYRKKGSKKSKRRLSRFKSDPSNRCSMNKKAQCETDPNCTYVKKRGCRSKQGTVTGGLVFEGPMGPPAMRIKKRKGSRKSSKRHSKRKSHGRKGSKKSSKRKGSKKSKRKSSKRYSKRR